MLIILKLGGAQSRVAYAQKENFCQRRQLLREKHGDLLIIPIDENGGGRQQSVLEAI